MHKYVIVLLKNIPSFGGKRVKHKKEHTYPLSPRTMTLSRVRLFIETSMKIKVKLYYKKHKTRKRNNMFVNLETLTCFLSGNPIRRMYIEGLAKRENKEKKKVRS